MDKEELSLMLLESCYTEMYPEEDCYDIFPIGWNDISFSDKVKILNEAISTNELIVNTDLYAELEL